VTSGTRRIAVFVGVVGLAAWVSAAPHASRPLPPGAGFVETEPPAGEPAAPSRPRRNPSPVPAAPPAPTAPEAPATPASQLAITVQVVADSTPPAPPPRFALEAGTPNPFRNSTTIHFSLPRTADVSLRIYDLTGRHVATLLEGERPAGRHGIVWNATGEGGMPVNAGVYVCRLEAGRTVRTTKLILTP
jgi:hypothetical protein